MVEEQVQDVTEADPGVAEAPSLPDRPWWKPPVTGLPLAITGLVALLPMVRIAIEVRRAPRLPFTDYWTMLDQTMHVGGGLDVHGLFEFRNQHPVAVAKLAFWANARLFDGSNRSLAVGVMLLGLAQVVVVAVAAARTGRGRAWSWSMLVVAASALLFARQGLWHFYKSMSGTAWLSADLFALLALTLNHFRRTGFAIAVAVLATLSYGTGLMVWPALIVATVLRDRSLRRAWPFAAIGLATLAWYVPQVDQSVAYLHSEGSPTPGAVIDTGLRLVGGFFVGDARTAAWRFGTVLVVGSLVLATVLLVRRLRGAEERGGGIWVGLLVYAIGGAASAAGARYGIFFDYASSRYAAIGALVTLSFLGMLVALLGDDRGPARWVPPGACALVIVAVTLVGGDRVGELRSFNATQDQLATAMVLDVAGGSTISLEDLDELPEGIEAKLRSVGHVPFDGSYHLDCGLLGSRLPSVDPEATAPGAVVAAGPVPLHHDVEVVGWLGETGREVDCVVLVDDAGTVVGAAGVGPASEGYSRRDPHAADHPLWFLGVGDPDARDVQAYVRFKGDSDFQLVPRAADR